MPLIEEHINAMKDALEPLRPRSTARCASRGMSLFESSIYIRLA